jgi:hypothetical protein
MDNRYIHFDFHKECSKMQWNRLSILMAAIKIDLDDQGYFLMGPDFKKLKFQTSVVRSNCMDCLDRTNVVQSVIAKQILKLQLSDLNIMPINSSSAYLEMIFQNGCFF